MTALLALAGLLSADGARAAGEKEDNPQVTRIYPARDFLYRPSDFSAPSLGMLPFSGGLGGEEESVDAEMIGFNLESLSELIHDRIPEIAQFGGSVQSMEAQGALYVKCTAGLHKRIEELLSELRRGNGRMVQIEARYIAVAPAAWRKIVGKKGGGFYLGEEEIGRLDAAVEAKECDLLEQGQTVGHDTQRVYIASMRDRSFIRDAATLVSSGIGGAAGIDPEVGSMREGMVVEVRPLIVGNGGSFVLDVKGAYCRAQPKMREQYVGSPEAKGAAGEAGSWRVMMGGISQHCVVELPDLGTQSARTTARVPAGKFLALGATSQGPAGGDGRLYLFLVRATMVVPE